MAPDMPRHAADCRAARFAGVARAIVAAAALVAVPAPAATAPAEPRETVVDGVPHVRNAEQPLEGVRTLRLEPQWRAGGEESDLLLGSVGRIVGDAAGNVYVLDRQLSQVQVFAPDGRHLRTLAREGDGPGEVRRPADLLLLPDGRVGIVQMMPGRIVTLRPDGTPAGNIEPVWADLKGAAGSGGDGGAGNGAGGAEGAGGGPAGARGALTTLVAARAAGDGLLVGGGRVNPQPDRIVRERQVARVKLDGSLVRLYRGGALEQNPADLKFDEAEDWFPFYGAMAATPDGRVYLASGREAYAIEVYGPDGRLERVIERECAPLRRTPDEKRTADETRRMVVNGVAVPNIIADTEPTIAQLRVAADGELWVLTSHGRLHPPAGALQVWDVFDARGRFVRQVALAGAGRPGEDAVTLLDDGRAVVVYGQLDAARNSMRGVTAGTSGGAGSAGGRGGGDAGGKGAAGAGDDGAELEVVCCRLVP